MSKKLYFLMCFVLVLTLSGAAQAVPIDDPNYNLSFEYHWPDVCGVVTQIYGHTGIDATPPTLDPCEPNQGVRNWLSTGSGFQGVDVFCPEALDSFDHCHTWPATDGIAYIYLQHSGNGIEQVLDGNDANAVITPGRQYTMKFDGMDFGTTGMRGEFYSASGLIASESFILPEIFQPLENCDPGPEGGDLDPTDECSDWHRDLTVSFIALDGAPFLTETLSIRFEANGGGGSYAFMDNVRLEWKWLTGAYYPYPEDGAEDVPRVVTLNWTPGLWAKDVNAHEVYFGTDEAAVEAADRFDVTGIFRGPQNRDVNSYTPTELPLELGQTYYWRIDEVNEAYAGPPAAAPDANGRWKGDIWSFEVTGFAINPDPEDEAEDVSLYTDLSWTPGTDSNSHDVYFGTSEAAVDDANQLSSEYMGNQDANDFNDFVPALELGKTYYWRIDEVNVTAGTLIKGKVWSFTVATYFRVDDMDSYGPDPAMRDVWKDYYTGTLNLNGAEVFVETDADFVRDGNSMRFTYRNYEEVDNDYVGSEAVANTSDLESGSNWTKGGSKALALYFYGAIGNGTDHDSGYVYNISQDQMYVAVEDGSSNVGILKWPDMNDIKEEKWHEWNIEMADPRLADVNLANIAKVYIGFGGTEKTGQSAAGAGNWSDKYDTVWFDDIRLYPPRCVPEYAHLTGSFRYINRYEEEGDLLADCKNDYFDLWSMGSDWLVTSYGNVTASEPCDVNLVGHWALDDDVSSGPAAGKAKVVDSSTYGRDGTLYDDEKFDVPALGSTGALHTDDCAEGTGALEFDGIDDFISLPALFDANTNTVTISAWIKTDVIDVDTFMPTIVGCNDVCNPPRLTLGQTGAYAPLEYWSNNDLAYYWTGWSWDVHPELIVPTKVWSFVALVVEPDKGTLYLYDGKKLYASTNHEAHEPKSLAKGNNAFIAGWFNYEKKTYSGAEFKGAIDDVRVYDYSLSPGEIMYLAFQGPGSQYLVLEPWRADANSDDKVDLKDYVIMAKNWLKEVLWPFE